MEHDHSGQVQGVAHTGLKGADAALAQDNVLVALGHDVLGAHHKFFQRVGKAALEQHGLFLAAHGLEQLKVLHIAGTHLDKVYILEQGRCSVFMISVTMGEPVARRASLSRSRPSLRIPWKE